MIATFSPDDNTPRMVWPRVVPMPLGWNWHRIWGAFLIPISWRSDTSHVPRIKLQQNNGVRFNHVKHLFRSIWRFPEIEVLLVIIRFRLGLPWNKPSSYGGTPMTSWNPPNHTTTILLVLNVGNEGIIHDNYESSHSKKFPCIPCVKRTIVSLSSWSYDLIIWLVVWLPSILFSH